MGCGGSTANNTDIPPVKSNQGSSRAGVPLSKPREEVPDMGLYDTHEVQAHRPSLPPPLCSLTLELCV
jgi:hypothetical protein